MTALPIFSPSQIQRITDCSLLQHFWAQSPPPTNETGNAVLETIRQLHASGGPHRVNLPATLRILEQQLPSGIPAAAITAARNAVAHYHRRLRSEWVQIIASNEPLALNIPLSHGIIRSETVIHRLDKNDDGGITAIKLIPTGKPGAPIETDSIEATVLHALTAAAYPHRRPVRVAFRWLECDRTDTLELSETAYRHNLQRLKTRMQAWLDGEILARPGLHCKTCPFKGSGCPLYPAEEAAQIELPDLNTTAPPATLSTRNRTFSEGTQHDETQSEP